MINPCIPILIRWEQTSPFEIDGMKELTTDSFCNCGTGGKITPLGSEENNFENIEQ